MAFPFGTALPPTSVEVHFNLTPDGNFTAGMGAWAEADPACGLDSTQGMAAPAVKCEAGAVQSGQVFCPPPPYDPNQCNSHVDAYAQAGIVRAVTLPPVYVGTVGGTKIQRYEVSLDYRLLITGQVDGSQDNRNGNVNMGLRVAFIDGNGQEITSVGVGGNGAGSCCGNFQLSSDSNWQFTGRARVSGLAEYAGETIQVGVGFGCDGRADQGGTDAPVALDMGCTAFIDNVRLDAYYTTG